MTCDECRALLDARHDGRLDADESADVAAHLAGCADCGAALQSLARADDIVRLAASGMGKSWAAFREGVMGRVAAEARRESAAPAVPKQSRIRTWRWAAAGIAAAGALAAGLAWSVRGGETVSPAPAGPGTSDRVAPAAPDIPEPVAVDLLPPARPLPPLVLDVPRNPPADPAPTRDVDAVLARLNLLPDRPLPAPPPATADTRPVIASSAPAREPLRIARAGLPEGGGLTEDKAFIASRIESVGRRVVDCLMEIRDVDAGNPAAVAALAARIESDDLVGRIAELQRYPGLSPEVSANLTRMSAMLIKFSCAKGEFQFQDVAVVQARVYRMFEPR